MKKLLCLLLLIALPVLFTKPVFATTYWVSPTGAAAKLAACSGSTPLSGADACSYTTVQKGIVAGDTVYYRAGNYNVASGNAITTTGSGTSSSRITFSSYDSEEVYFIGNGTDLHYGFLSPHDYITLNGIDFKDFQILIRIAGNYNIVSYCKAHHTAERQYDGLSAVSGIMLYGSQNWIHHNTVYNIGGQSTNECREVADGIKICGTDDQSCSYNTIEDNVIYGLGHTLTDDFGKYSVWRNNVGHNEGWKESSGVSGTATGGSTTTLIDTTKDFEALGYASGHFVYAVGQYNKRGTIASVSGNTITFTQVAGSYGSPTFAEGTVYYVSTCNQAPSPTGTNPSNGMYGHRCFSMTGYEEGVTQRFNLFEGNRSGYASTNPANGGADAFTLGSPGNIVRYNDFFGSNGPGINFKNYNGNYYSSGSDNRVYNNTIYSNGLSVFSWATSPVMRYALQQYTAISISNIIKNNLLYSNGLGDYLGTAADQTWESNLCDATDATKGCTALTESPFAAAPDMSDMAMTALTDDPDFTLASDSEATDAATYLTTATEPGTNSTTIIVTDALYFQAGSEATCGTTTKTNSFGSCLSSVRADWIAIGTVSNYVPIANINYTGAATTDACNGIANCITLASPMSWDDNAPIWLYKKSDGTVVLRGDAPDIGAHEYDYYDLTITKPSNGTITGTNVNCGTGGSTCVRNVASGTDVELTFTADSGYHLTATGGNCSGVTSPQTITVNEAKTCTATFSTNKGSTAIGTGAGSGSMTIGSGAGSGSMAF